MLVARKSAWQFSDKIMNPKQEMRKLSRFPPAATRDCPYESVQCKSVFCNFASTACAALRFIPGNALS